VPLDKLAGFKPSHQRALWDLYYLCNTPR
jgi:hypothetical protein